MAKKQRAGKSFKDQYSRYKAQSKWAKNGERKLERHLKKFPLDDEAVKSLRAATYSEYKRRKPGAHKGTCKGLAIVDKRTKKVTDRIKNLRPLVKKIEDNRKTVAQQFLDLGIVTRIPKGVA